MTEEHFKALMLIAAKAEDYPIAGWFEWWIGSYLICMPHPGETCNFKYQLHMSYGVTNLAVIMVTNDLDELYNLLVEREVL